MHTKIATPTVTEFKQWARDCQPAASAVLMARAFAQVERERVDAYIAPIFASYGFQYAARWADRHTGPIPTQSELYLCDDEPCMADYYAECDHAHRAHGFTGPKGHCPALIAENLIARVEHALLDLAQPLCGINPTHVYGKDREQYLDLLIGACFAKR